MRKFQITAVTVVALLLGALIPSISFAAPASAATTAVTSPPAATIATGVGAGDDTVPVSSAHSAKTSTLSSGVAAVISPVAHTVNVAVVAPAGTSAPTMTDAQIDAHLATLSGYWVDQTGGQISSISRVGSVVRYASAYTCSDVSSGIWDEAAAKFGNTASTYTSSTALHLLVIGPNYCGSAGLATMPSPSLSNGGLLWTQDTGAYMDVITHEFGHNMGLNHANVYLCADPANVKDTRGTGQACPIEEYYDTPDVMGAAWTIGTTVSDVSTSLNAINRETLGALQPGEQAQVSLSGGSTGYSYTDYTLTDAGLRSGQRSLKITDPQSGTSYYVEFRNGNGSDSQSLFGKGLDKYTIPEGNDGVRVLARSGTYTLNFTTEDPATGQRQGIIPVGETFTSDSGEVIVTPVSTGPTSAVVSVEMTGANYTPLALTAAPIPTVTGTAVVGQQLTAIAGAWAPAPVALSFQWMRDGISISGATSSTYGLASADAGAVITVVISGSQHGYIPQSQTSAGTAAVLSALTATPVPMVTGPAIVGQTLTADPGIWAPGIVTLSYQWQRDGVHISGATSSTYALTPADAGAAITVVVSGSQSGYVSNSQTSAGTAAVLSVLTATPVPTVTGAVIVGQTLTAIAGTWDPAPVALSYQWQHDGIRITGATAAAYTLVSADQGATITVAVTGALTGYSTETITSAGTSAVAPAPNLGAPLARQSGSDRFATSSAISAASFAAGVPVVYIANGFNFPDALSAAPAAGRNGAPVLLVSAASIPASIQAELTRLKPGRIVVLGGVSAVSDAVKTALQGYTSGTVTRLSGGDRFSTSASISASSFAPGVPVVYIANGFNFPDALSAAPVAGKSGAPILLVSSDSIPTVIQAELTRLKPGRIVVLGGVNAVSDAAKTSLQQFTAGAVTRLSGSDRFATSAAISAASFAPGVPVVYIANGFNFPDALSAAPVAGMANAPVLLVSADSIPASIQAEMIRLKPGRIVVLGGTSAVSSSVSQQLAAYISN